MPFEKKYLSKEIAVLTAVALLQPISALAQRATLEEVIVTAQKRVQSAQDVPVSISALNAEMISDTGVDNITKVLPMLPGVTGTTAGITTNAWAIRGISTNDWSTGSEPSVAIYIDEAYVGRNNLATGAFFDLERIEAINGPQGTLFGRNAAAGAITMTTNKPTDENGLHLGIGAGNEGQEEYDVVANYAATPRAALRFAYHGTRLEGIWKDVVNDEEGFREEDSYRLAGRFDVSDKFTALLTLNYGEQETNMGGVYNPQISTIEPGEEFPDKIARTTLDREENETSGVNLRLTWELGNDMTLTSITDAREFEFEYRQDVDGSNASELIDAILGVVTGGVTLEFANEDFEGETLAQEFRLSGATDTVDWFVGINYFDEELDETQRINMFDTALGLGLLAGDRNTTEGDNKAWGIYGDARWAATQALAVTVGARWSRDEKDWCTSGVAELGFIGVNTPQKLCDSESWSDFTPRLVLDYAFSDDAMLYTSVSKGYKAGGFNPAAADFDADFFGDAVAPFDPETNLSYELGAKTEFLDGSMRLNGAVYFSDYEDLQVASATIGGILISNAAEAEVKGLELDWTYAPSANLLFTANYSYIDSEYTAGVLKGNTLNYAPENSYAASVKYDMDIGDGNLAWFAMYVYQSDFFFDPGNTLEEDGYGLLNAKLTYTPGGGAWDVSVSGDNLTDEDYAAARQDIGLGTGTQINRGLPRLLKVNFNVYF